MAEAVSGGDVREGGLLSRGFAVFAVVLAGQAVSILGTGLTGFALGVWVFQRTGSATQFALVALALLLPVVLLLPVAGALVDRWDRRWAMIVGDAGSGLCSLGLAALVWSGRLEVWHIWLLCAGSSAFSALQYPAFTAASTLLVPRRHLGRAAGLTQLAIAAAQILAPLLAGALLGRIGLRGVLLVDVLTFLVSLATLAVVRFPGPAATAEGAAGRGSLRSQIRHGWLFIRERAGLRATLLLVAAANLGLGMVQVLVTPLVLGFAPVATLGRVLAVAGCGMLAGSLVMSVWGGPRQRIHGVLGALLVQGLILLLGGVRPSAVLVAAAAFVYLFAAPVLEASGQAIWQAKVPADVQGAVFAVRRMVGASTLPIGYALAGPLADRVFEPLLMPGGALAASVGVVIGIGQGRGIGLLFIVLGLFVLAVLAAASRNPRLRRVESELPDA